MDNLNNQKVISLNSTFSTNYLDAKHLYLYRFGKLPSVAFINYVDGEKAFDAFVNTYRHEIEDIYQSKWYDKRIKTYHFDTTFVVLKKGIIVEFDEGYCELYYASDQQETVLQITGLVKVFKERQRRQPLEINLIVKAGGGMDLKPMEIKRTKLNLDLFYEADFKPVDEIIIPALPDW
jgi:hypothetical protein